MKFLTIQRAGLGSISIPADRVSSIAVYGDGSRVNYARADGTLDYLYDDRAPFAVLHELDAIHAVAPEAPASPRGFIEVHFNPAGAMLIAVSAIKAVQGGSDDDDQVSTIVLKRKCHFGDWQQSPRQLCVADSYDEIVSSIAEASR